jgi:hypothetical protein
MTRDDVTLAVLACAEEPMTSTQLQKAVFLVLKYYPNIIDEHLPKYNFVPGDYGPTDHDVTADVEGVLQDSVYALSFLWTDNFKYYMATIPGWRRARRILATIDKTTADHILMISKMFLEMRFTEIVALMNQSFPEMCVNMVFANDTINS